MQRHTSPQPGHGPEHQLESQAAQLFLYAVQLVFSIVAFPAWSITWFFPESLASWPILAIYDEPASLVILCILGFIWLKVGWTAPISPEVLPDVRIPQNLAYTGAIALTVLGLLLILVAGTKLSIAILS